MITTFVLASILVLTLVYVLGVYCGNAASEGTDRPVEFYMQETPLAHWQHIIIMPTDHGIKVLVDGLLLTSSQPYGLPHLTPNIALCDPRPCNHDYHFWN